MYRWIGGVILLFVLAAIVHGIISLAVINHLFAIIVGVISYRVYGIIEVGATKLMEEMEERKKNVR